MTFGDVFDIATRTGASASPLPVIDEDDHAMSQPDYGRMEITEARVCWRAALAHASAAPPAARRFVSVTARVYADPAISHEQRTFIVDCIASRLQG